MSAQQLGMKMVEREELGPFVEAYEVSLDERLRHESLLQAFSLSKSPIR